jgi:Mrp family chromosome partitioning ATPase
MKRSDDRLSSSTEIIEHFSEPILGQIPDVSDSRDGNGIPLLDPEDERYTYAEAFRSLRSSLIFMPNQSELKTLIVTSAIPNEGKSTVASNLAVTMAASGARVLLVDADLRRGDIAELFNLQARALALRISFAERRGGKMRFIPRCTNAFDYHTRTGDQSIWRTPSPACHAVDP